jgi:hypothetical protein
MRYGRYCNNSKQLGMLQKRGEVVNPSAHALDGWQRAHTHKKGYYTNSQREPNRSSRKYKSRETNRLLHRYPDIKSTWKQIRPGKFKEYDFRKRRGQNDIDRGYEAYQKSANKSTQAKIIYPKKIEEKQDPKIQISKATPQKLRAKTSLEAQTVSKSRYIIGIKSPDVAQPKTPNEILRTYETKLIRLESLVDLLLATQKSQEKPTRNAAIDAVYQESNEIYRKTNKCLIHKLHEALRDIKLAK